MADAIRWGKGRDDQFRQWLTADLRHALDARAGLERQWLAWLDMYRSAPPAVARWPFEGAANETIPAIATDTDQLYAKFMQTVHAAPNLWSLSPLNERWVHTSKPLQDFLTLLDTQVLHMYNVDKRALLELCKLGTCIYKTGWTFERRRRRMRDAEGKAIDTIVTRSVPFVDHVRLADFLLPPEAFAIDPDAQGGATWVAERLRVTPDRLRMLAEAQEPNLPNIGKEALEEILRYEERALTLYDTAVVQRDYQRRFRNETPIETPLKHEVLGTATAGLRLRQIELWEVHVRYPAQNGEVYDDLVILWHHPTSRIVRATLNPYDHGQRPYEAVRYFPGEGFYGIGIAEQKEMFQRVLSRLVNYATDGAMLSNTIMLGAKAGANILPDEPIYPSKVWITDGNPRDDLFPIQTLRQDGGIDRLISLFQTYGERRTGVSDIQLGSMNELPGRTPATTMVSLLQEGNRRPDLTIKEMRNEGLSRVGLRVVQLIQQYLTSTQDVGQEGLLKVLTSSLGMPEGMLLAEQLTMPAEPVELGIGVTLTASSGSSNKEVDRQNALALLQLAGQVGPQLVQFTQMAAQFPGTPVAAVAQGVFNGLLELFGRVLEQHDVRDPEAIIPQVTPPGASGSPGPQPGPAGYPPSPAGPPGMGALGPSPGGNGGPASPALAGRFAGA